MDCLLLALWCPNQTGQAQHAFFEIDGMAPPSQVEFTARVDGSKQRYLEFLPLDYTPTHACSLMIFLHGHGSDRWQIAKGDQWREIQAVCDVAARHRMILLSPDYRATTSWMGPAAEADVVQIIRDQKTQRHIHKVFLSGGSMGGTSVLIFAALHSKMVNGVVSLNGTANLMEYAGFPDAIAASYGGKKSDMPREYRKRSPELVPRRFRAMPVAFTAGGRDTVVPPQSVLRLSKALEQRKPGNVLMLYREEGGHSTSYQDAVAALEFVIERASREKEKSRRASAIPDSRDCVTSACRRRWASSKPAATCADWAAKTCGGYGPRQLSRASWGMPHMVA